MTRRAGALLACCAWLGSTVLASCFAPQASGPTPEEYALAMQSALRSGNIEQAATLRDRARRRYPRHGAVLRWCSAISFMLGEGDRALAELIGVRRSANLGGMSSHECDGLLGEMLFQQGRFGESIAPLLASLAGVDNSRRRALVTVARWLPFVRRRPGAVGSELPLLEGSLPELLVSSGELQRAFVVDTGTSMTTLSQSLADELLVTPIVSAGDAADGTGKRIPVSVGVLDSFGIGDIGLGAQPVLVVDDKRLTMRDLFGGPERPPGGVVALDLLSLFRLTVDPDRRSIVFEPPRGLQHRDSVRCLRVEGRYLIPVTIEGRDLWFILDTGASHSSLTDDGIEALPEGVRRAGEAFRRVRTASGTTVSVREVQDIVLRVSSVRFRGVALPVVPRETAELFPVHGVLGADLLLRCRMTLDGGRVRLTAPDDVQVGR